MQQRNTSSDYMVVQNDVCISTIISYQISVFQVNHS